MKLFKKAELFLYAPCDGKLLSLKSVPDKVFASGYVGKGFAIDPSDGEFNAPCNGSVQTIFKTCHAFGFSLSAFDILLHIGCDTVALNGEGFTAHTKKGKRVKPTSMICSCDMKFIKSKGKSMISPVVVTTDTIKDNDVVITAKIGSMVKKGDLIAKIVSADKSSE